MYAPAQLDPGCDPEAGFFLDLANHCLGWGLTGLDLTGEEAGGRVLVVAPRDEQAAGVRDDGGHHGLWFGLGGLGP